MAIETVTQAADETETENTSPIRADELPLEAGEFVGRYVVLERIGAGGMGTVYAAFDPELDRKIAIKVLSSRYASESRADQGARRLQREAQALARLHHPNVVPVYDVGSVGGRVYLAMAFVDGQTLGTWIRAHRRTLAEVLRVFELAGRGLSAAHAGGLIHRDFKPDNVMIDRKGRVFVMDFGLARGRSEESRDSDSRDSSEGELAEPREPGPSSRTMSATLSERLTRAGAAAGTPAYMAPEQHLGQELDARTDQFSLCVTLWEALYGVRPFGSADEGGALGLGLRVIEGDIAEPPDDRGVPTHVRRALERGLRPVADDRWPSIDALFAALRDDPRVRWRRWALAAAGLAVVGAGLGMWRLAEQREARQCQASADAIPQIWNERRDAALGAFRAAADDGEIKFGVAEPWIQRWTERAAEIRYERCLAALDDDSESVATQAVTCVDERADEFAALVDLWTEADETAVRKSVSSATRLPNLDRCEDRAWLSRRPAPPRDSEQRAAIAEIRHEIAAVNALASTGNYDAALERAKPLVSRAEAIGWDPLTTDALHLRAEMMQRSGDYRAAVDELIATYRRAVVNGDDDVALDILGRLIPVLAYHLSRADEAEWWGHQAETLVLRLGERGSLRDASIRFAVGTVAHTRGRSDQALEHYQASLDIYRRTLGPNHPNTIGLTNNVGLIHEEAGRYQQALAAYTAARDGFIGLYGEDHPDVGTAVNNIGSILLALGRHDEADAAYRRALEIRRDALGDQHPEVAATMHNLAIVSGQREDLESALSYHRRALAVREQAFGAEHPETAHSLNGLGTTLHSLGRFDEALEVQLRALAIRRAHHGEDHVSVARSNEALTYTYLDLGRIEDARKAAEEAIRIRPDADDPKAGRARALLCRSAVHAAAGDRESAIADAEQAVALRAKTLGGDHADTLAARDRLDALRGVGP